MERPEHTAPPQGGGPHDFFACLMDDLMAGMHIPKVQMERVLGPILGFFLAEALSVRLGRRIDLLCPEFPIRHADSHQSTNVDWLMCDHGARQLWLVELKTTDTGYRQAQATVYQDVQDRVLAEGHARHLIDDVRQIQERSNEHGKYAHVLARIAQRCGVHEGALQAHFATFTQAQVLYLAPRCSHPLRPPPPEAHWHWLGFHDLPEALPGHAHDAQWRTLRAHLQPLDTNTRNRRNGRRDGAGPARNYTDRWSWEELLHACRAGSTPSVRHIGLIGWRKRLPTLGLPELRARRYKVDTAREEAKGTKLPANWMAPADFLAHLRALKAADPQALTAEESLHIS